MTGGENERSGCSRRLWPHRASERKGTVISERQFMGSNMRKSRRLAKHLRPRAGGGSACERVLRARLTLKVKAARRNKHTSHSQVHSAVGSTKKRCLRKFSSVKKRSSRSGHLREHAAAGRRARVPREMPVEWRRRINAEVFSVTVKEKENEVP